MSSSNTNNRGSFLQASSSSHSETPLNAGAAAFDPADTASVLPVPSGANAAVWSTLTTGTLTVNVTTEREAPNANPNAPLFLKGITHTSNPHDWESTVLPYIRRLTFMIGSTADTFFAADMLRSTHLPNLYTAITKINMTGFHWFSGISANRASNPYLLMAANLPSLVEITLRFHVGGLTKSAWSERQMVALEAADPIRAKARKVMALEEVVNKWDLVAIFGCGNLQRVRIEYIWSDIVAHFCQPADPSAVLRGIQGWMGGEFRSRGRTVAVELVRLN
ncbi:hypothetical protein BDW02DRAFT_594848 [Decorospora gaudefroyi]|uniref:Uncharacterized protein n=1 Tax=Decorospora gaudefroyi TaxID=184978 RepID=A0A6A5KWZ6_9PLEO|nr:hypothetical protein BDW02DRAFT_594848 [Decorospora gaudefroyi]